MAYGCSSRYVAHYLILWYTRMRSAVTGSIREYELTICLGLPHVTMKDDVYKEYAIPKGSIVFANLWYVPATLPIVKMS